MFKQAHNYNAKVVYISSDHVFSGRWFGRYLEDSKPNPKNYYGTLKLASEALAKVYPNVILCGLQLYSGETVGLFKILCYLWQEKRRSMLQISYSEVSCTLTTLLSN